MRVLQACMMFSAHAFHALSPELRARAPLFATPLHSIPPCDCVATSAGIEYEQRTSDQDRGRSTDFTEHHPPLAGDGNARCRDRERPCFGRRGIERLPIELAARGGVAPLLGTRDRDHQGRRPTAQHRTGDRCPHAFAYSGGRTRGTCPGAPYRPSKQLDASCRQSRGRDVGLAAAPIAAHRPPVVPGASRRSRNRTGTRRHLRRDDKQHSLVDLPRLLVSARQASVVSALHQPTATADKARPLVACTDRRPGARGSMHSHGASPKHLRSLHPPLPCSCWPV